MEEFQKLVPSDPRGVPRGNFGTSVSINSSGNVVAIGAPSVSPQAVYIFKEIGGFWSEFQRIPFPEFSSNEFGESVSINNVGDIVIIGDRANFHSGNVFGAAFIYRESSGIWSLVQKLISSDPEPVDQFGKSVSINNIGNSAVIGAVESISAASEAYIFREIGGTWREFQKLTASDPGSGDRFGLTVSIDGPGNVTIIGSPFEDQGGSNAGAAYIFNIPTALITGGSITVNQDGSTKIETIDGTSTTDLISNLNSTIEQLTQEIDENNRKVITLR